jgi:UDP-2,4-diacetamido-2,4,6-trideoxy-beta-L-altropyranose hydrolase
MDAVTAKGFRGVFLLGPAGHASAEIFRNHSLDVVELRRSGGGATIGVGSHRPAENVFSDLEQSADAAMTVAALQGYSRIDVVLVDHYGLDATWETRVQRELGAPVAAIDGLANRSHTARLVIDPTYVRADEDRWVRLEGTRTRLLQGPLYSLIAPHFRHHLVRRTERDGRMRRVLVNFGGSDHLGMTERAIAAIERMEGAQPRVDVVVGAAHRSPEVVEQRCSALHEASYHRATPDMAGLMAAADLAIGSGGVSTYERAFLGLPALAVVTAANQQQQLAEAERAGALRVLGAAQDVTAASIHDALTLLRQRPERLREMGRAARAMMGNTDVPGSVRIAEAISDLTRDST